MLLIELFDRDNILCPEWLSNEFLEDDWEDSVYSFEEGKHTWKLKTPLKNAQITYDGNAYNFYGILEGELIPIETITKDTVIQY